MRTEARFCGRNIDTEREPVLDHCGVVGIYCSQPDAFFKLVKTGLESLQNRGQDGAGIVLIQTNGTCEAFKGQGNVENVLRGDLKGFDQASGSCWIGQVRYGTDGDFSDKNVQPVVGITKEGEEVSIGGGTFKSQNGILPTTKCRTCGR